MSIDLNDLLSRFKSGDLRALSRMISIVENESTGSQEILESLDLSSSPVITGITGPPGAGKSTLINALINEIDSDARIAILAVDPSSPFNSGSLLGDRLRMSEHFNNENVYIRSLATRGALGGLSNRIHEVLDVLRAASFDYIIVETVGVGQSEVEIASMADTTVVVFVPESGDEVQALKSGIMEIADIIVINKSDREGAEKMFGNIAGTLHDRKPAKWEVPVLKTVASENKGLDKLLENINSHSKHHDEAGRFNLLLNKANRILVNRYMSKVDQKLLREELLRESVKEDFNIYTFLKRIEL